MAARFVSDENLDLYVLTAATIIVALLGVFGVAGATTLASVILALLAALAYSQIRSRRYVAEIASVQRRDPFSIFRRRVPRRPRPSACHSVERAPHRTVIAPGSSFRLAHRASPDGPWYEHFAAEARRMRDDGTPWPLSGAQRLARSCRPPFQDAFGSDLLATMSAASEIVITGVARNALLRSYYSEFEEWLKKGRPIRIVLMDPACDAVAVAADRYYAGRSADTGA